MSVQLTGHRGAGLKKWRTYGESVHLEKWRTGDLMSEAISIALDKLLWYKGRTAAYLICY